MLKKYPVLLISCCTAQLLNYADIARDAEIDQVTVKKWLLILETLGLVFYLHTYSNNTLKRIIKTYAVAEIIKTYYNCGKEPYIYYYRDKDAKEIDIVLERDGQLFPIEIKKTARPASKQTGVFKLLDKSTLIRSTGGVLCMTDTLSAFSKDELIVPVGLI